MAIYWKLKATSAENDQSEHFEYVSNQNKDKQGQTRKEEAPKDKGGR